MSGDKEPTTMNLNVKVDGLQEVGEKSLAIVDDNIPLPDILWLRFVHRLLRNLDYT